MSTGIKIGLGSAMGTLGALGIVLSLLLGWLAAPGTCGVLLALALGGLAGAGATLAVSGLIEYRRGGQ